MELIIVQSDKQPKPWTERFAHVNVACSRLRDWVVKSRSVKRNEKNARELGRDGAASPIFPAATAPFPKSRASYFRFTRLIRPHYTIWEPGTG